MSPQIGTIVRGTVAGGTIFASIAMANLLVDLCLAKGIHVLLGAAVSIPLNVLLLRLGQKVVQSIRGVQD